MNTSFGNKLLYGIGGGIASNTGFTIMGVFFIIFSVDAWGLNPVTAGTIVLVTRLIDTFTDPLMGAIADGTRSKLGKYRFWIIIAGPLTGLMTFLVFAAPNFNPFVKVIYMYIVYIGYSIISTAANIPYHSLTAYITDSSNERRLLVIIKQLTGLVVGQLLQYFGVYLTITLFDGSIVGYQLLGMASGILIAVGFLVCAFGAREVDNYSTLEKEGEIEKQSIKEVFMQLTFIIKNASLRNIAIATSTNNFASSITGAVSVYFYSIVLGSAGYAQTAALMGLAFGIISYFITFAFSKRMGNKESFVLFTSISMGVGILTYLIFNAQVPLVMVTMISLAYGFSQCAGLATWMMVTDCADDIKLSTGKNGAGIASSCLTFANKFGTAIGGFCTGLVLSLIGYDPNLSVQPESVVSGLILAMIMAPVLGHICSLISMRGYPLSKTRHAEIQIELYGHENK